MTRPFNVVRQSFVDKFRVSELRSTNSKDEPWDQQTLHHDKNHEFLNDPNISHTTLHVWGLVMGYTHVNAQFPVISIYIPKDNCAFSSINYAAWRHK